MSPSIVGSTREAEALAEIGQTAVHPIGARILSAAFLLLLLSSAALELAALRAGENNLVRGAASLSFPSLTELRDRWSDQGALAAAALLRDAGTEVQDRLDRDSRLAAVLRPRLQLFLSRRMGYGNSQVLLGAEDWLFFRDDFDHLTGPPFLAPLALARRMRGRSRHPSQAPDPLPAIVGLAEDLRARGIGFVVVPVPTKLGVAWESFLGRRTRGGPALDNPSRSELLDRLRGARVEVFDPTPILRAMEIRGETPYMRFDSHWSPAGLDRVAARLAAYLRSRFDLGEPQSFYRQAMDFERRADLADLLGLDPENNPYLIEPLEIQTVNGPNGRPYGTRSGVGPVLLIGDSFSRLLIRNKRQGGDANFAAQLAFHLQSGIAMRAEYDAGEDFARRVRWLRHPHALDARRVVVFEVAERALSLGDWTPERLAPAAPGG